MSLARAEWRRLFKRRFTRWMIVFVVLVFAAIVGGVAMSHQAHDPATIERAEAQAQREFERQQGWMADEIRACEQARDDGQPAQPERHHPPDCEEIREWYPQSADELVDRFMPSTFEFRSQFGDLLTAFAAVLALFGFLVGASFIGAEWRSGGMTNLLLWRPRRWQVLTTKLGALVTGLSVLTVLFAVVWTVAFWLVATSRGITDTMTAGAWQSFGLTGLRAMVAVLVAGAVGFAVASIGRHTATALGAAVAVFVLGGFGMAVLVSAIDARFPGAWLWTTYANAWMDKSVTFRDFSSCGSVRGSGPCEPATLEITWQIAGAGMVGVVLLLAGAALWHIRARDIA